jgi:hypothetical protein
VVAKADDLPAAIARLLALPKPDPEALSQAVHVRFGPTAFRARLGLTYDQLFKSPAVVSRGA